MKVYPKWANLLTLKPMFNWHKVNFDTEILAWWSVFYTHKLFCLAKIHGQLKLMNFIKNFRTEVVILLKKTLAPFPYKNFVPVQKLATKYSVLQFDQLTSSISRAVCSAFSFISPLLSLGSGVLFKANDQDDLTTTHLTPKYSILS